METKVEFVELVLHVKWEDNIILFLLNQIFCVYVFATIGTRPVCSLVLMITIEDIS
jgi:hypothetical protein